jgi:HSP20 family molecular chaperone IbpA
MSRVSLLSSPFLLGFDQLERVLERAAKSANDGYPPYNIEQIGDATWRITLAVAGFAAKDLSVTLEDNQLLVSGGQDQKEARAYLYRGIANRQFQRRFVLANGIEITRASLENGLLNIGFARPDTKPVIRKIQISDAG